MNTTDQIQCALCGHRAHALLGHLVDMHSMTPEEYITQHPGFPTVSQKAMKAFEDRKIPARTPAPAATELKTTLMGMTVPVNAGVEPEKCLPLPNAYRYPTKGAAKSKTERLLWALLAGRNCYVWGFPGTGKDAAVHAFSNLTRTPTVMVTFRPGTDLAPWFYTRQIDVNGTGWVYGTLWNALTKGIKCRDGETRAPLILLSDVDRADPAQAEWFRILTDSIEGRIPAPDGAMIPLFTDRFGKKPQFVCTANTCGSGDARGRATSAYVIDNSIIDRLGRKIEFVYLNWDDEKAILVEKFPTVAEKAPSVFDQLKGACEALRTAIGREELAAEFTHRGICEVLAECEDRIRFSGIVAKDLLSKCFAAWAEGLDADNRLVAKRLIDPHLKGGALGAE